MNPPISAVSVLKKIGRIVLKTVLVLLGVLILVVLLIQTAPVQNFLRGKAQNYLQKKLNTKVEIGKIYISFPKNILLERIYVEDRQKDTLLYSGELKVDLDMWKLFKSEFVINDISLKQVTATVNRVLPDTTYNFQFIIDAFASPQTTPATPDTSTLKIQVKHVRLNDIRLRYNDAITGNDMKVVLSHFDTNIETFDPGHSIFEVPSATIKGLQAIIVQRKPLVDPEPEAVDRAEAADAPDMQLRFKKIALENCYLDYGNDVSAFYTTLDLRALTVQADQFDLPKRRIQLDALTLAGTRTVIRLGKKPAAKVVVKEIKKEVALEAENNWTVLINNLDLDSNHFKFDDDNAPRAKEGMDYSHLDIRNLTLQGKQIFYQPDSIAGTITKGTLQNNDFRLNQLRTQFLYTGHQAFLKDLLLETPGTRIERDIAIRYPAIETLADNIGLMQVSLDVRNSKVLTKDILTFAPMLRAQPMFANPNATWLLDGKLDGSISNLRINRLRLQGLQQTNVEVSGTLKGLPDAKKVYADLTIKNISSSATDLRNILPKGSIPSNITLPARMTLTGKLTGSTRSLTTNLQLNSSLGSAGIKGKASNLLDTNNISYDVVVNTRSIDLQKLLNQPDLGPVTLDLTAKGRGINPKTMDAAVKGTIAAATYKGYTYQNFELDGNIAQQVFAVKAGIQNEPVHIALDASGNVAGEWPAGKFDIMIDSLKTLPLNLTTENITARAHIVGDFTSTNPDSLLGELLVTNTLMVRETQRFELDTVRLSAIQTDTGQALTLQSPIVFASIYGRYRLTQAATILQKSLEPYFSVAPDSAEIDTDYDFRIHTVVHDHPQLKNMLPDLKRMDSIHLDGHFSGRGQIDMDLDIPGLIYGTNQIHNLKMVSNTAGNELKAAVTLEQLNIGTSMTLYNTSLNAALADNKIDFALNTRDKSNKSMYHLEGIVGQPQKGAYTFSLKPDSLLLNYKSWTVNPKNIIHIDTVNITADDFVLQQGAQKLAIQTVRNQPGEPLGVDFSQFKIATILSFVQSDSMLVDGALNGNVTVSDLTKNPRFVSDLTANDLSFNRDTLGNLRMQVSNPQQDNYVADIALSGRGNDLTVKGNYEIKPENNSSFNLKLAIQQLQLNTLEGISMGAIKKGSGTVNGNFDITGTPDKPSVNGELNFNKARLVPSIMNSHIAIDQQKIRVTDQGIVFNKFTITDSVNNKATLDGTAYTTNFTNYKFDLHFNADNFQALNTVKKDNKLYYGSVYFDSRLNIKGTELSPSADGSIKINDKTKLTVVLPQEDPSVVDRDGIVRFVDRDNVPNDSLFLSSYDSLNTAAIRDFDVSVNITVDKNAEFNLIVDEGNGDLLRVKGEAALTGGIDRSGKITLTGSYELQEGSYDLTVNFLKRKFLIQKGSKLVWMGEPTKADVDITAVYIARTAPIDLVEKQLVATATESDRNKYRQKVPFEVHLKMKGELLKPSITFDILLPEDKNYNVDKEIISTTNERLALLRQEPSELNKQVFAVLLLNHFIGDNPFATGNSSMTAESFARQSVSKLLTEQLNQLAANLIEGVDINFDVASTDDYTTGEKRNRTDLNVAVSKRLLNDRLTVTVGSNFALENPNASQQSNNLAENIALDYKLSKDGRYMLRAYRRNEFEGVLEGYIIETGVGIVITLDYNRFRDIFISRKQRERMRLQRRQERELQQQQEKEGVKALEEDGRKRDIRTKQLK